MFRRILVGIVLSGSLLATGFSAPASTQPAASARQHAPLSMAELRQAVAAPGRPAAAVALDEVRRPAEVLHYLGLRRGDAVLDYFTGSGYYAEIMGRAVGPRGRVTAWNPASIAAREQVRTALTQLTARTPNVQVGSGPVMAFDFPVNGYDFVMLHLVYHDAYWESAEFGVPRIDPNSLTRTLFRATRPGGTVAVIDHVAEPGGDTRAVVQQYHRIDPAVIRADFQRAGFRFAGESPLLRVPSDTHRTNVFDPAIRGRTDRVVYRFVKPRARRR